MDFFEVAEKADEVNNIIISITPAVNFGEVQRALLAKYILLTSTLVPLGYFHVF